MSMLCGGRAMQAPLMWPETGVGGYQDLPAAGVAPLPAAAGQYAEPPAGAVLLVGPAPATALPAHLCSTI